MQKLITLVFVLVSLGLSAQQSSILGEVYDLEAKPLSYATVALLNSKDSTIEHFCITNSQGKFEISKIPANEYLLQIAFMGYETFSKKITLPAPDGGNLGTVILKPTSIEMGAVQVTADRVPLLIKKDTVEYNAAAFKTKPDAVAEDLLKKLPGVEVDRAGNIKAMGEDVNRVLVDGKEFFSNDPKVATKNLPAESINKVQVYDKKTDEAELLGIDDSEYNKTINFVLKDDMKSAVFGDVKAGGGVEDFYQGNAKVYRFTDKHQFAMLGMMNNINKPGFSFQDYIDFNGGIQSMMSGGGTRITIDGDNSLPVDFGQTITGKLASGAGGINYSYEFAKNNRFNISYMGNGSSKDDITSSNSRNFTESGMFEQNSMQNGNGNGANHLFNIGWRNKASTKQHFMLNGIVTLMGSKSKSNSLTESLSNGEFVNSLTDFSSSKSNQLNTSANGSWMRKGYGNWKMLKVSGNFKYSQSLKESDWRTISQLADNPLPTEDIQFSNNDNKLLQYSATITSLRGIGSGIFLEPSITGGTVSEILDKEQGQSLPVPVQVDSLSPLMNRTYQWVKPTLMFKKYSKKSKINLGFEFEYGKHTNELNNVSTEKSNISSLLPQFSWDYEYKTSRRFSVYYSTYNSMPTASQLLPIISASNPFAIYFGNRNLRPEYRHSLNLQWFLFDQFSFTSVFASLNGSYTKDKINQSVTIADDLSQEITLVNVPDDYTASASINFSTSVKPLGIKVSVDLKERWNQGISYVNTVENINTNLTHKVGLKVENRKKDKWDVEVGGTVSFTDARYSIQKELNRKYNNYVAFGEIRYTPNQRWHFCVTADITSYNSQSFNDAITVPLLSAEINYHFLDNNRGMLSLEAFDLLNKNTGVTRVSEYNYIRETNSNMIGRYFMLSFKYKLNKSGGERNSAIKFETSR
ncbi:MAG: outer membrane beta-barrel protein [Bacteroidales bacterium]